MGHIYLNCRSRLDFSSLSLFGSVWGLRLHWKACHSNSPTKTSMEQGKIHRAPSKLPFRLVYPWIFWSHFEDPKNLEFEPGSPHVKERSCLHPRRLTVEPKKWRFGTCFSFSNRWFSGSSPSRWFSAARGWRLLLSSWVPVTFQG